MLGMFRQAYLQWRIDKGPRMGAALAFYTVFSLAPLLVTVIYVSGIFFGRPVAEREMIVQIGELIGPKGALTVRTVLATTHLTGQGITATIAGLATLLFGTTGTLVELQDGLNRVWKVMDRNGVQVLLRRQVVSLALVLGIAFVLLMSLVLSAVIAAISAFFSASITANTSFWNALDFAVSCAVITVLFAMIFKFLPDTTVRWNDVWIGSAVTAVLFTLGKFLVGFYIGTSSVTSVYGAAGSFVAVLIWIYYSALLLYYGAEFTKVYADRFGSRTRRAYNRPHKGGTHDQNRNASVSLPAAGRL